jgi:Na+/pantothenate symporter
MSTLDGLLVGISTITANDLVLNLLDKSGKKGMSQEEKMKFAFKVSHIVLIVIAILTFFITLNPPKLLGIFGQVGVYALVVAAVPPLLVGILFEKVAIKVVWIASIIALCIHFLLYFFGKELFPNAGLAFGNPGVTATIGFLISIIPTLIIIGFQNRQTSQL